MSLLEKMGLVERIEPEPPHPRRPTKPIEEEPEDMSLTLPPMDFSEADEYIDLIYENAGLPKDSHTSIFRVQEIGRNLPETLPTAQKRDSVLGLLKSFDIEVFDLQMDADDRIQNLQNELMDTQSRIENSIESMSKEIEDAKILISEKQEQINIATTKLDAYVARVKQECEAISALRQFITKEEEN